MFQHVERQDVINTAVDERQLRQVFISHAIGVERSKRNPRTQELATGRIGIILLDPREDARQLLRHIDGR